MSKGLGSGFTLVEVMVALVVLAVSVLGLSAAVSVVSSNTKISHLRTKVSVRAQAEMDSWPQGPIGWDQVRSCKEIFTCSGR